MFSSPENMLVSSIVFGSVPTPCNESDALPGGGRGGGGGGGGNSPQFRMGVCR